MPTRPPEPAPLSRLASRAERLAQGESAPTDNPVLTALDAELRALANRYSAVAGAEDAAWIPLADAVARGLRSALGRSWDAVLQVEVDGSVQRWDAGDGVMIVRVVCRLPRELGSYRRAGFVVSPDALDARLAAPRSAALGPDWLHGVYPPVAARPVVGPDPARWLDVDAALAALPSGAATATTLGGSLIGRVGRVTEAFGDRLGRDGWRSEHQVAGGPWILQCQPDDRDTGIESITIYALPRTDAPAVPQAGARVPAPNPGPNPSPPRFVPDPLLLPGPVESQFAGVVAIPWSRLEDSDYLSVLQAIALEVSRRKARKNPLVVWAWHSPLLGYGADVDGPALHLGLTPDGNEAAASMKKLCGPFADRAEYLGRGPLERGARPVVAQGESPGSVYLLLEEVGGRPMALRLEMTPGPPVSFLPAELVIALDDGEWSGAVDVRYRIAKVEGA
jgi:hypothetical protein